MNTPYHGPPTEIPGLDDWNAANKRSRDEYRARPFAHSRETKADVDRTARGAYQAAYRARKAGRS